MQGDMTRTDGQHKSPLPNSQQENIMDNGRMMKVSPTEMELVMNYRAESIAHRELVDATNAWKAANEQLKLAKEFEISMKDRLVRAGLRNTQAREELTGLVV